MNTLVPLEYYSAVYFNILLLFALILYFSLKNYQSNAVNLFKNLSGLGYVFFTVVFVYMGTRPISYIFADMGTYAKEFASLSNNEDVYIDKDLGFDLLIKFSSHIMSVEMFFIICAFLYIYPLYIVSKKYFAENWVYAFVMIVMAFSFWAYGTNGIRNGLATSFFLFALSRDTNWKKIVFMIIAILFHKSLMIALFAYIISLFNKNTKMFLIFWALAIPLSLALGSFWENFFFKLGLVDDSTLSGYLVEEASEVDQLIQLKTGFRWDFLLYSCTGVYAGWYFIIKRKFDDPHYNQLYIMYLIANAFWILVIRANYSNRFAYLSWFMLSIIIVYPLLKQKFFDNQSKVLANILILYFMFTYFLNFVLSSN